jgi:hypothetical protein
VEAAIPKKGSTPKAADAGDERVLRAKYLDWCSARVADHFLALSPDEIFELAERAAETDDGIGGHPLSASWREDLSSYRVVVERVTGVLAEQLDLPSYDQWLELYRQDPAGVEAELLGFWKDVE